MLGFFILNVLIGYYGFDYLQTIIKLLNEKPMEDYFLSIIHSLFLGLCASLYLLVMIDDEEWSLLSGISLGYTLFEYKRCFREHDYLMIIHHLIMCLSILSPYLIYYGFLNIPKIRYILARIFICEISNFFLWTATLMYKYKKTENIIFKSFLYISLITYFILRVYNFTDMLIYFYMNNIMISFYSMIPILMMNYYWFYLLAKRSIN
jgi:hypothetical protein